MGRYVVQRCLQAIFVLLGVTLVVFFILHLRGDPSVLLLPANASPEQELIFRAKWGLDQPFVLRYWNFLKNAVRGDFGMSLYYHAPAIKLVLERMPATIELAFISTIFAVIVAVPLGVFAAIRKNTLFDFVARIIALLGQAIPTFWFGIMMIILFSLKLHWLPTSGRVSWENLVMPVIAAGLFAMASITRIARSSMLEVLNEDYMRTAKAKGLTPDRIFFIHGLKNAILPVITMIGMEFGSLLGGAVVIETIFAWPGVGQLAVNGIYNRDFPIVLAAVTMTAFIFIVVNLVIDIMYCLIDPRIKVSTLHNTEGSVR
ncbi:MAG TPA: ABC transporter permease [Clostridiales bacterium]|jgi:ABC-type dipeptide/oligopeptide/nickel transport system permease component|nr:ABC transporter permease [Clostridiales bacterium]